MTRSTVDAKCGSTRPLAASRISRRPGDVRRMAGLEPLNSALFRRLAFARAIDMLGNAVAPIALAFAVLDLTGSATRLGLVVGSRSLANVIFLLFGGVVADRLPKNLVLVGSSWASAVTQGAVAALVLLHVDSIALLAALSAANGIVSAVALPASSALLPATVDPRISSQANALMRLAVNTSLVVGASLGGLLVASIGSGWSLAIDALSFAVVALLFGRMRLPTVTVRAQRSKLWAALAEGWDDFRSRTWFWMVVLAAMVSNAAFVGSVQVLGPIIADATFGRALWGAVLASQTVGMVVGGLIALRLRLTHALRFGVACTAAIAVIPFTLALIPEFYALVVAGIIAGIALEQMGVTWETSLQRHIATDRLARAYSYDMFGSLVAVPVGQALAGPVSVVVGVRTTLLGAAVLMVLSAVMALASRSVRHLRSDCEVF